MATVSGAHRELITCDGGKRQFQFVSVYRSLAFTFPESFSFCRIDTFTPGQDEAALSCEYWATGDKRRRLFFHLFFPLFDSLSL